MKWWHIMYHNSRMVENDELKLEIQLVNIEGVELQHCNLYCSSCSVHVMETYLLIEQSLITVV